MTNPNQPAPEDQDLGMRSRAEILQNDRNIVAHDLIYATDMIDFYGAYGEGESPHNETYRDASEVLGSQRQMWEKVQQTSQENLGRIDAINPNLHKMETAPRREPNESVEDFFRRTDPDQPIIKIN